MPIKQTFPLLVLGTLLLPSFPTAANPNGPAPLYLAQAEEEPGTIQRRRRGEVPRPDWIKTDAPAATPAATSRPVTTPAPQPVNQLPERRSPPASTPAPRAATPQPALQPVRRVTPAAAPERRRARPVTPEVPVGVMPVQKQRQPDMDPRARPARLKTEDFRPDPDYQDQAYDIQDQLAIYGGKRAVKTARPLIELGYPQYAGGPLGAGHNLIGRKNLVRPQTLLYGDWRTASATIEDRNGDQFSLLATRLNLDLDVKLTATERLHALFRPLEEDGAFTRSVFAAEDAAGNPLVDGNGDELEGESEVESDGTPVTLFFEGDIGAIWAGLSDRHNGLDLPFSIGLMPLLLQNGVWLDDAFRGLAFAIPAFNSPRLDISNMDLSFYFGYDDITTGAVDNAGEDETALLAVATFIERRGAYWEAAYAFVQDNGDDAVDRSYHNLTVAWTRRFGAWLSHSTRVIANLGQDDADEAGNPVAQTADGALLLLENSLITSKPYTSIPYFNLFYGVDSPQPLARTTGGVLNNTGINFEADVITGYPALDPTARNAYGGALGWQWLFGLKRQLVLEVAGLSRHGDDADLGNEYAVGLRFQQPLNYRWILRADAMAGRREEGIDAGGTPIAEQDLSGVRLEIRVKF